MDDNEILRSMLSELKDIKSSIHELDKTTGALSPVIIEHNRRITKIEDLNETLRIDLNNLATMQREVAAQFKLMATAIAIATPIASIFLPKIFNP